MRPEEDEVHMHNIVNCIHEISGYTEGMSETDFARNESTVAAVARNLQMIGNAAQMLSTEFKLMHTDVDFKVLESLRFANYNAEVEQSYSSVWNIIHNDLPVFKYEILSIASKISSNKETNDSDVVGKNDSEDWIFD